ncbi:hypothetical protein GIB67_019903 [Kingdonia uniflora]|uniref:RNase H type-1 domain-containing protein n=1 Tax=Kingdonia uniflora TaxID=39325 RepID=A0A7J7MKJ7_9MAGN|nr:hypothetical protein GIB67_019903 [Kingdonia uniflora]
MFKNTFQSGFLSILYSLGSKPLQIWDKEVSTITYGGKGMGESSEIQWEPPPEGYFLLTTDGSLKDDEGYGGLLRDCNGECVLALLGREKKRIVAYHEIQGISRVLSLSVGKGYNKIWVATDSSQIVDYIQSMLKPPWRCRNLMSNIRVQMKAIGDFRISHKFRESNEGANFLSSSFPPETVYNFR